MGLKERIIDNNFSKNLRERSKLAGWIRDNREDLVELVEKGYSIKSIQATAISDLAGDYPTDISFDDALFFSLEQLKALNGEEHKKICSIETISDCGFFVKYKIDNTEYQEYRKAKNAQSVYQSLQKKKKAQSNEKGWKVSLDILELKPMSIEEFRERKISERSKS